MIEKYARAAASTARTPPNSPARRAALEAENAARVAAEQFVKGLEAIEAREPTCWAVIDLTNGGSVEYTAAWPEACHEHIGNMITEADMPEAANFLVRKLYARPVPAQAVPTGERQAVLLTDAEVRQIGDATLYAGGIYDRVRAIETAVLAANGLEVRRG